MTRQKPFHHRHRPFFERLLENCVVRVARSLARKLPRLIPIKPFDIHQNAHQFRHDKSRMRIVELDEDFISEIIPRIVNSAVAAKNIANRTGDKEVLLPKAQLLARHSVVVRVKNLG